MAVGTMAGARFAVRRAVGASVGAAFDIRRAVLAAIAGALYDARGPRGAHSASLLSAYTRPGWALWATDIATDLVTFLGFIDEGSTTLPAVALADGTYNIEARPWRWLWRDCRSATYMRVTISGGAIVAEVPPPVEDLRAADLTGWGRDISWTWLALWGTVTPVDFGLWFSASTPVNTAGAPDATLTARTAGANHMYRYAQPAARYVAVAARDATPTKGPVSEIYLDYPSGSISAPERQWATGSD